MDIVEEKFEQWAILEIMGHNKFAGMLREETIGGASFLRIDIPATDGRQAFTKYFGASSVYCITPVTEDVAKALAAKLRNEPIQKWDLPDEWIPKLSAVSSPLFDGQDDFESDDSFN